MLSSFSFALLSRLLLRLMHGVTYRRPNLRATLPRLVLRLMGSLRHGLAQAPTAMTVPHTFLAIFGALPIPVAVPISIPISLPIPITLDLRGFLTAMPTAVAASGGVATADTAVISATAAGVATADTAVAASRAAGAAGTSAAATATAPGTAAARAAGAPRTAGAATSTTPATPAIPAAATATLRVGNASMMGSEWHVYFSKERYKRNRQEHYER